MKVIISLKTKTVTYENVAALKMLTGTKTVLIDDIYGFNLDDILGMEVKHD